MFARRLFGGEEQDALRNLLYQVYIRDLAWTPDPRNPSGLRVGDSPSGRKILEDQFDSVAIPFGVFDGDQLVGGVRLLPTVGGSLEFEHYHAMPSGLGAPGLRKMEINRLVMRESYQSSLYPVALLKAVAEHLAANPVDYLFAAVSEPEPADLCRRLGFEASESKSFRYAESDKQYVRLHHLNCSHAGTLEKIITMCERLAG